MSKANNHIKKRPFKSSYENLFEKTQRWISEIDFITIEQDFLKELLSEYIIGICKAHNFEQAKLLLESISDEKTKGSLLKEAIVKHQINLSMLLEGVFISKEETCRKNNKNLKNEIANFINNFKFIKRQTFELILKIMKLEKQQKLLANI